MEVRHVAEVLAGMTDEPADRRTAPTHRVASPLRARIVARDRVERLRPLDERGLGRSRTSGRLKNTP